MPNSLTPFTLVFKQLAEDRFDPVRRTLAETGADAGDRDVFLLNGEVGLLLKEMRPEEGMGEAIDHLIGFLHHAYLMWDAGQWTFRVSRERAQAVMREGTLEDAADPSQIPSAYYVQWPSRLVWGQLTSDGPHEPLDGWFVSPSRHPNSMRVLGVFGLHPDRLGFSVVETEGGRQPDLARPDGTPLFAPILEGGGSAGLYSLIGAEELLELAWRARSLPTLGPDSEVEAEGGGSVVDIR